jgi:hypothetical protein
LGSVGPAFATTFAAAAARIAHGTHWTAHTTHGSANWAPHAHCAHAHPTATIILWSRFKILCLQLPVPQHGHESYIITFFELTFVFLMKEHLGQAHRDSECVFFDNCNEDGKTKPTYLHSNICLFNVCICLFINWV